MALFSNLFDYSAKELKKMNPIKEEVLALEEKYAAMSEEELRAVTPALKERLANGETLEDILPDAFAACREASVRAVGLKPYPVQILGGIVLHNGGIAEMKTGEGKTLVATPARCDRASRRLNFTFMPSDSSMGFFASSSPNSSR